MVHEALTSERLSALEPEEAAAYFVMRRAEQLTSGEEQLLAAWLASNPSHRRAFDGADRAWRSFADAEGDEILTAMRSHALASPARTSTRPALAAAAAVLLVIGAALFLVPALNPWKSPTGSSVSTAPIQYASAHGMVKDVRLPDGSAMTLDAESAALARFDAQGRRVELQRGRAFFDVLPDRSRPFAVTAAGHSIVAVGTRFDVDRTSDGLAVTLVEGHVRVEFSDPAQTPVTLQPGQQYIERLGKATIRTIGTASESAVAWRLGLIRFDDEPLAAAAAVMNRYSQDQIVIRDPAVGSLKVSGQFRAGEAARFAATLAEMHNLRPVRSGNQIELVPPK